MLIVLKECFVSSKENQHVFGKWLKCIKKYTSYIWEKFSVYQKHDPCVFKMYYVYWKGSQVLKKIQRKHKETQKIREKPVKETKEIG